MPCVASEEGSFPEIPKFRPVFLEEKEALAIRGEGHTRHAAQPKLRHRSRRKGHEAPKTKHPQEKELTMVTPGP